MPFITISVAAMPRIASSRMPISAALLTISLIHPMAPSALFSASEMTTIAFWKVPPMVSPAFVRESVLIFPVNAPTISPMMAEISETIPLMLDHALSTAPSVPRARSIDLAAPLMPDSIFPQISAPISLQLSPGV